MTSTCLVCYEESQYFVLPPCNHKEICWKCCLKLVQGSIFSCPFCKNHPQIKSQLLFVTTQEMENKEYQAIMKNNPFRSNKNTFYFYSTEEVAEYIQSETSFHCILEGCGQVHETLNFLKRHLNVSHKLQFCDVCLDNRRCIIAQQKLYSDGQLQVHLKQGDISQTGEVVLYHPICQFCVRRFYDLDAFKLHMKMSSHLKCEICDVNSQKMRYVYYKNYEQLQRHHKKTHFMCDVGDCVGKKLENVFASDQLLQQHKRRCHRKYKGDKNERVENILLGFNKNKQQQIIQFDGIGKNFQFQFKVFQRIEKVDKQTHLDEFIDIRQFYPEMVKGNNQMKPEDVVNKLYELQKYGVSKTKEVKFNDIPIFKPLEMTSLTRIDCQKLLRRCFSPRDAEGIIEVFFTKRNQFASSNDYFADIQRKMKKISVYAFYLIFPQLIRFMKDQNKNKVLMDQFYGLKLRLLIVSKQFLFHSFDRYSQILQFIRSNIEYEIISRCQSGTLNLDIYCKYLKQNNFNFYLQNQDELYFVPKEKVTNLYHMIERCKTKDFLRMNWLLKVGLPQETYQNLMRNFYYKTKEECEGVFKMFKIKELALVNLYTQICLEALIGKNIYQENKRHSKPHYLTDFLKSVKRPASISMKLFEEVKNLEQNSNKHQKRLKERGSKMIIFDDSECPSLLGSKTETQPQRAKKQQQIQLGIGKSRLRIWNEQQSRNKKTAPVKREQIEQFPALMPNETPNVKPNKTTKTKKVYQEDDDQFPVYNFQEKHINPKFLVKQSTITKKEQINQFISFNNKKVVSSGWNQQRTREKIDKKAKQIVEQQRIQQNLQKAKKQQKKINKYQTKHVQDEDDEYLKLAMAESLKTLAQQQIQREQRQVQQLQFMSSKKDKNVDEVFSKKKKKYKRVDQQKKDALMQPEKVSIKKQKQLKKEFLFEEIQKEATILKEEKQKRIRLRLDYSNSSDEQQIQQPVKKPSIIINNNQNQSKLVKPFEDDDFMPIGGEKPEQQSIINRLQKEGSKIQENKNNRIVKKNRKGKETVVQRFNLNDLP